MLPPICQRKSAEVLSVCDNVTLNPSEKMSLMRQERVTLSRKELMRVAVLGAISGGTVSNADAADSLGISMRQVIRLKKKYSAEGAVGLIHGNRGRKPRHALPEAMAEKVVSLYKEPDNAGCNFQHFTESLEESNEIKLSAASVGRILRSAGITSKKKHRRKGGRINPAPGAHRRENCGKSTRRSMRGCRTEAPPLRFTRQSTTRPELSPEPFSCRMSAQLVMQASCKRGSGDTGFRRRFTATSTRSSALPTKNSRKCQRWDYRVFLNTVLPVFALSKSPSLHIRFPRKKVASTYAFVLKPS